MTPQRGTGEGSGPAQEQEYAGTPRPDALLPVLDAGQLAALRDVGGAWEPVCAEPEARLTVFKPMCGGPAGS